MALSKAQLAKLKEINNDPVKWAQVFLVTYDKTLKRDTPWTARWYQSQMIKDKSKKKVYRCGRRTGKCISEDSLILDYKTGEQITAKELYERQKANLVTLTEDYKLTGNFTNCIFDNGIKDVYRVTTNSGRYIDATGNHPLFTGKGWTEIDNLQKGQLIAIPKSLNYFGNKKININVIKLLAYMIGDGNCTSTTLRFSTSNDYPKIKEEMKQICDYFNCDFKQYEYCKDADYHIVKKENKYNNKIKNKALSVLKDYGVFGKNSYQKTIPKEIFQTTKENISIFLSRLYATDGWVYASDKKNKRRAEIGYCSVSEQLIRDIQHLLLRFGINSHIQKKKVKYENSIRYAYQLFIYKKQDIMKFCNEIGIYAKEEAIKNVMNVVSQMKEYEDYLPKEILSFVEEDRISQGLQKKDLCLDKNDRIRYNYDIQRSKLRHYGEVLNNEDIINFSQGEYLFEEIKSIEHIGKKQTYDFSIPETMNFVVNDIITHNSECMVVESLYNACNHRNYRVLLITPYENQIRLLFQRINELRNSSPLLNARVVSATKNPYKIEFDNGSLIMGFTTGASSGSSGASIRGQAADLLILDECDYMADGDFDSILMIAGERPDIRVIMSSTPTGKRGNFYKCCTDKTAGYTEHYHPSTHNPGWNDEMEAEFRAILSEQGYVHEVMAEFGSQELGVFDKQKLDKAIHMLDYTYNPLDYYQEKRCKENNSWPLELFYDEYNTAPRNVFRTMGVDWDKYGASSSLLVLEFDTILNKFKVLKRYEMPKAEYSYDNAVNKIIELNEIYNPSWIYCDRGSGEYQIERLHIYGEEHPESGLKQKVVGWSFSNKIKVLDPATGEEDNKAMKPFMVSQLQIAFERESIILSPYDEILYKQLIDYEVDKIGANGVPTFTSKNEHFVDALGLAYLAMVMEFKQLTGVMQDLDVTSKIEISNVNLTENQMLKTGNTSIKPQMKPEVKEFWENTDFSELRGERQVWVKTDLSSFEPNEYSKNSISSSWSRDSGLRGWNSR